jgi:hypothetical protein
MAYGDANAPDDGSNDGSSGGNTSGSGDYGGQGEFDGLGGSTSSSSSSTSGSTNSVGPGTGRNENNPAKGVNFDGLLGGTTGSSNTDSAMAGLLGLFGFDPSAPVPGVNTDTPAPIGVVGHPQFGLSGTPMDDDNPSSYDSTDPGATKSVNDEGKALSFNAARAKNIRDAFGKKAQELQKQIDLEVDPAKKRALQQQLNNLKKTNQYSKFMASQNPALNFAAKTLSTLAGMSPLSLGPTIEERAIELGFIDETTPEQAIAEMENNMEFNAPDGSESRPETVYGLTKIIEQNPEIFKGLSNEQLLMLVYNPKMFWKFYEERV